MPMSHEEAQQVLAQGIASQPAFSDMMRHIEAMYVVNFPDAPADEIDAAVERIRRIMLGEER
jgi:hypothetical protein